MAPADRALLPDTAEVADDGSLWIGGCAVADLATTHGTPVFVYDELHLRNRCREAIGAFGVDRATDISEYSAEQRESIAVARIMSHLSI